MKRRWIRGLVALAAVACAAPAYAQLQSIPSFIGADSEGFEGPQVIFTPCIAARVFNNKGDLCTPGASGCHTTSGWSYVCTIYSYIGTFFYGSAGGATEITFDTPASRFGGWFGTNSGQPDATFQFFDVNSNPIATVVAAIPADCTWYWQGWQVTGGQGIKSVLITSNAGGGAYLDMDELQADFAPIAPTTYCTAKTNSLGCLPAIAFTGAPDHTGLTPFMLSATNILGNRPGHLFYGVSGGAAIPFKGGTMCVAQPLIRTPVMNSGGTSNTCQGVFQFNFNAYCASGANPALVPGQQVWAQYWSFDPGFAVPDRASFTNAIQFRM